MKCTVCGREIPKGPSRCAVCNVPIRSWCVHCEDWKEFEDGKCVTCGNPSAAEISQEAHPHAPPVEVESFGARSLAAAGFVSLAGGIFGALRWPEYLPVGAILVVLSFVLFGLALLVRRPHETSARLHRLEAWVRERL